MNDEKPVIYSYNDDICFRQCSLANKTNSLNFGDCTSFDTREKNWKTHYYCNQFGIHLHCRKHTGIELELCKEEFRRPYLKCPKCDKEIEVRDFEELLQNCLKRLNMEKFKDAKLIRLDDWYIPEIKVKENIHSNYWIEADVKTDKDKDTIIVLYVGKKDSKEKSQFFIKPEKLQLTSDHKDLDPATVLSKIEVTLKDRTLTQEYDKEH